MVDSNGGDDQTSLTGGRKGRCSCNRVRGSSGDYSVGRKGVYIHATRSFLVHSFQRLIHE